MKKPGTKQEIFDYVVTRYVAQGKLSKVDHHCYYRFPDDPERQCLIGFLLPDEKAEFYDSEFCSIVGIGLEELNIDLDRLVKDCEGSLMSARRFMHDLQTSHDRAQTFSGSLLLINRVAEVWKIEPPSSLRKAIERHENS